MQIIVMNNMGEENNTTISVRIPEELNIWIEDIQKEFETKRGFQPSKADILKNIVKQFRGKFIV